MEASLGQLLEIWSFELNDLLEVQAMSKHAKATCNSVSGVWGLHLLDSFASCLHDMFVLLSAKYGAIKALHVCNYCNRRCLTSIADAVRYAASHNMSHLLEILLEAGADPNVPGPNRYWYEDLPLHAASKNGHSKIMQRLVSVQANPETRALRYELPTIAAKILLDTDDDDKVVCNSYSFKLSY